MTEIKGWHVFGVFAFAFGIIITVNLTLAFNAVRSFPGLEVKNSYVASQSFDADRKAQDALNWDVTARIEKGELVLSILKGGRAVVPQIIEATFGRATMVAADQTPEFVHDGLVFRAPVDVQKGNWNLRLKARSADGTLFQRRIILRAAS
ncbi:FixH protein [Sulfitobacter noctilucae]|uniref:FixH family protein n=1 Tax=Sulfitobacter noctilucae TaxID=1342302 RepID=UPI00046A2E13|nr:FixH family protein [Sulfitobacter noctilucae]KIN60552.1 FixH protein [Sulfitobacter noctilucae]